MHIPARIDAPWAHHCAAVLDVLAVWFCAGLAYRVLVYQAHVPKVLGLLPNYYAELSLLGTLVLLLVSLGGMGGQRWMAIEQSLRAVVVAWFVAVLALVVWLFLTKTSIEVSRLWFLVWACITPVMLVLQRMALLAAVGWLQGREGSAQSILVVGDDSACDKVRKAVASNPWCGYRVRASMAPGILPAASASMQACDEVWLCLPLGDDHAIQSALHALRHSMANIRIVPDAAVSRYLHGGVQELAGVTLLDVSTTPMTGTMRLAKAVEDFVGASLILCLIAIPMLAIAVAIKVTSRGPVLYKQLRHGWNGKPIWVYKFRTMVEHQEPDFQVTQATRSDPRVTRVGAFLRKTSLDELPQFLNVLQGRMSIVGPRPHAVAHNEYYKELVPGYMRRHTVKPGITGWAQINGYRGETDTLEKMQRRVDYDMYYINHLSIWFDLKIILMTVFKGWVHHNAY
ncbi:undecaprenyl-phosphate glucose phosphotransferase [Candidatus Symbiobacter mobilis]|uniref:Lipopolysaccharide biosynthesis protein WcaJ n=1 Tax=Candidatus Symbiobacter mobilis CR TaxID=946483 RepID=U5N5C7_9BURK|nr:undecaprenyl-phosphate glucose phosphotransferase [Candidatus Symbiobacter mobilis]AGX86460.1 lipopolysaccharide biosynthesis protein WcaJ [Candidatus Symbiobacter mobilis CR]